MSQHRQVPQSLLEAAMQVVFEGKDTLSPSLMLEARNYLIRCFARDSEYPQKPEYDRPEAAYTVLPGVIRTKLPPSWTQLKHPHAWGRGPSTPPIRKSETEGGPPDPPPPPPPTAPVETPEMVGVSELNPLEARVKEVLGSDFKPELWAVVALTDGSWGLWHPQEQSVLFKPFDGYPKEVAVARRDMLNEELLRTVYGIEPPPPTRTSRALKERARAREGSPLPPGPKGLVHFYADAAEAQRLSQESVTRLNE